MQDIEDAFVAACHKLGTRPNSQVMRRIAVDLAGSVLTGQGLIALPGRGSISPADLARSMRREMPEGFDDHASEHPPSNLTEQMAMEVVASRKQLLPTDWNQVRSRYAAGSLTARYMEELAAARKKKQQT